MGKNSFRGPGNPDCQIVVINLLYVFYAKMLRETETEEALGFFVIFLSLVVFQLGGGPARPPSGYVLVKPKTIKIGIHSFPAWRSASKGTEWSLCRVW